MANQIKSSGAAGAALQVTKPARAAGLVKENREGEATHLSQVRVFAFDQLLLVIALEAVSTTHTTELVVAAAQDTDSIYRAIDASVQIAGNGYQVQLPPAEDAGFREGDNAPCQSAPGIIVLSRDDGTAKGTDAARLAADLITIRNGQLD
jgi:hypothetical protein